MHLHEVQGNDHRGGGQGEKRAIITLQEKPLINKNPNSTSIPAKLAITHKSRREEDMASENATGLQQCAHLSAMSFLQTNNAKFPAQRMQLKYFSIPQNWVNTE